MSNSSDTASDKAEEQVEILSTEDEKIKLIGNLLGNDSSRNILKLLLEKEMTANEIAQKTGQLLSLIIHHLQKMQEAGMIRITKTEKNTKGHDMKYYGPTKLVVLIFPSKASDKAKGSKSLRNSLNKIYKFVVIGIAGITSWAVIQPGNEIPKHTGSTSINSGGYDIMGAATEASSLVYRATMNWNIPTPIDPTGTLCGTTGANQCYITLWTGLSKNLNASMDMAQVGTDSICKGNNCASGHIYGGFLETSSGSVSTCGNYTYATGDSMFGKVDNEKISGGSVTKYDFYLTDTTQSQTCSSLSYTFGSTYPHYAHYLSERPQFPGPTYAHLAKYAAITGLYGQISYGGSTKTILTPYNNGWFNVVTMWNGGTQNEQIAGIAPTNTFSITWLSSTGT